MIHYPCIFTYRLLCPPELGEAAFVFSRSTFLRFTPVGIDFAAAIVACGTESSFIISSLARSGSRIVVFFRYFRLEMAYPT